jgi:hypothetical protein
MASFASDKVTPAANTPALSSPLIAASVSRLSCLQRFGNIHGGNGKRQWMSVWHTIVTYMAVF